MLGGGRLRGSQCSYAHGQEELLPVKPVLAFARQRQLQEEQYVANVAEEARRRAPEEPHENGGAGSSNDPPDPNMFQ